jgi:hypothetical protein
MSLVLSLDFSRAAGDMGFETGLSSSLGARGRLKRMVMVLMLIVWCHSNTESLEPGKRSGGVSFT